MNSPRREPAATSESTLPVRQPRQRILVTGLAMVVIVGGIGILWAANQRRVAPETGVEIVRRMRHDPDAFTQGLIFADGTLYESTGQYGSSTLRQLDVNSGKVVRSISLSRDIFGEGITDWKNSVVMLTWKKRRAYVFTRDSFQFTGEFRYTGEGWGLTHDGSSFIMSDGSNRLRFLDPQTFKVQRQIAVTDGRKRINSLNELEYVNGEVWANIWYSDRVARIDPANGRVVGWIDMSNLWPFRQRASREQVLNGIAYDAQTGRIFVTGKNWPEMFEVRLKDK